MKISVVNLDELNIIKVLFFYFSLCFRGKLPNFTDI